MSEDMNVDILNEDGSLKSKEEFLEEMEALYDAIEQEVDESALLTEDDCIGSNEVVDILSFKERVIWLTGEIVGASERNYGTSREIIEKIITWNIQDKGVNVEDRRPIHILINSEGGDMMEALAIIDAIKGSKTPVYTHVIGEAYSAAFLITLCGKKRFGTENSTYLFHEGMAGFMGDAHKLNQAVQFYKNTLLRKTRKIILDNSKISEDAYEEHIKDDWFFDANEAAKLGVIDDINGGIFEWI